MICLEHDKFKLLGVEDEQKGYYRFSINNDGYVLEDAGGKDEEDFIKEMSVVCENKNGIHMTDMKNAHQEDIVAIGSYDAEYIGYVYLSGYTTFYFFRKKNNEVCILIKDSEGVLLTSTLIDGVTFSKWGQYIRSRSMGHK